MLFTRQEPCSDFFWHTTAFHINRNHNGFVHKIPHAFFDVCLEIACLLGLQSLYSVLLPRMFCAEVNMSSQHYGWEKALVTFHFGSVIHVYTFRFSLCLCLLQVTLKTKQTKETLQTKPEERQNSPKPPCLFESSEPEACPYFTLVLHKMEHLSRLHFCCVRIFTHS